MTKITIKHLRYFDALAGVTDPEAKRKIIGGLFIEIFDEESAKLHDVKWLAQGTIYPDVIESAGSKTGKAHVIKSHHNVGGLPDDLLHDQGPGCVITHVSPTSSRPSRTAWSMEALSEAQAGTSPGCRPDARCSASSAQCSAESPRHCTLV